MSNALLSVAEAISGAVDHDAGVLAICEADSPLCQVGTTVVERDLARFNDVDIEVGQLPLPCLLNSPTRTAWFLIKTLPRITKLSGPFCILLGQWLAVTESDESKGDIAP